MSEEFQYIGTDNLEVMLEAVNYNRFILNETVRASQGAKTALDFGAGIGTFAGMVRDQGFQVSCVEPDAKHLEQLRGMGFAAHASIEDLPSDTLEFVYTLNVLEHIEDDESALRSIRERLRPGGRLFIYVPALMILWTTMDTKVEHYRRYHRKGLLDVVRRAGFEVERVVYADSMGCLVALLYKLIGSKQGDLNPTAVKIFDRILFPLGRVLDRLGVQYLFGKNLCLVARRAES